MPAEILVEIIRRLPKKDIKSICQTSKCLHAIATRYLFASLYISSRLKDREAFTAISEHPVFRHLFTELVYDSTNISFLEGQEQFNLNKTSYTRFLTGCQSSPRPIEFSKAALRRGFKSFAVRLKEHMTLTEYDGEKLRIEFRYNSNLFYKFDHSAAPFFAYNGGTCIAKPGLVTKKKEPPRTFLHLFFHLLQPPTLLFSLTLLEMRLAIFEYLTIP